MKRRDFIAGAVAAAAVPAALAGAVEANIIGGQIELADDGSGFALPTFTAPISGRYKMSCVVTIGGAP